MSHDQCLSTVGFEGPTGRACAAHQGATTLASVPVRSDSRPWVVSLGSAARAAEKRLRKLGFRVVAPSESFYVTGTAGPLVEGETERARAWAEKLGERCEGRSNDRGLSQQAQRHGTTGEVS